MVGRDRFQTCPYVITIIYFYPIVPYNQNTMYVVGHNYPFIQ